MGKRFVALSLLMYGTVQAMTFDNRFLPLLLKPYMRRCEAPSHLRIQPFFMNADRAFGELTRLSIPDIDGTYDTAVLARALVAARFDNPLRSDLQLRPSIPWSRKGRLDAQGVAFLYELPLGCFSMKYAPSLYVSFGINTMFAHVSSRNEFLFREQEIQLPPGDQAYLFTVKQEMHHLLGVTPALYSHTGMGDTDLYFRFGSCWDYLFKCRSIAASLKVGAFVPTATATPLTNPAAIPLGGEKHWGMYLAIDNEIELKADLFLGWVFYASKRFKKTRCAHMPVLDEPSLYGAVTGPLQVDPGWTFTFNPYVTFEGLREGFGAKAQYTLISHLRDQFCDLRSQELRTKVPTKLGPVHERSSWGMEYVTIGAFYDFGKTCGCVYPKISAYWDIPVNWLISKRASKTNSVSLMFELDF